MPGETEQPGEGEYDESEQFGSSDKIELPNNSPNNSETILFGELFGGAKPAPQASIQTFENVRHSGRQRKNEKPGIHGDLPIAEVVRFRAKYGRHIEGMSQEMQEEYDYWYFTAPNKRKDKDNYARHVRAWNNRIKWLSTLGGVGAAPITDLSTERAARGR